MSISENLKRWRTRNSLTQEQAAVSLRVTVRTLARLESEETENPQSVTLKKLRERGIIR